jgi:hypothetical protein
MIRHLLLAVAFSLFASTLHAQTFRVPFHTFNGVILLDSVTVNDKRAVFLLDTGSSGTIASSSLFLLSHVPLCANRLQGKRNRV